MDQGICDEELKLNKDFIELSNELKKEFGDNGIAEEDLYVYDLIRKLKHNKERVKIILYLMSLSVTKNQFGETGQLITYAEEKLKKHDRYYIRNQIDFLYRYGFIKKYKHRYENGRRTKTFFKMNTDNAERLIFIDLLSIWLREQEENLVGDDKNADGQLEGNEEK